MIFEFGEEKEKLNSAEIWRLFNYSSKKKLTAYLEKYGYKKTCKYAGIKHGYIKDGWIYTVFDGSLVMVMPEGE